MNANESITGPKDFHLRSFVFIRGQLARADLHDAEAVSTMMLSALESNLQGPSRCAPSA
jgi:hypothetical protein